MNSSSCLVVSEAPEHQWKGRIISDFTIGGSTFGRPGKVICIGLNYREHAIEAGLALPDRPIAFAKWPSCLIGNGDSIRIPSVSTDIDYEAELAVVIGSAVRNASIDEALDHVAGYTCFNDVTARDIQAAEGQFSRSKSFDTFGPIGPFVPASEIENPQQLTLLTTINGEVVQQGSTADMVFSVAEIITFLSQDTILDPGDVIATGTPAGIGLSKNPPRFLAPGDEVTVEIEGIGRLTNPVIE